MNCRLSCKEHLFTIKLLLTKYLALGFMLLGRSLPKVVPFKAKGSVLMHILTCYVTLKVLWILIIELFLTFLHQLLEK